MPPKIQTPSQKLKNKRICYSGNIHEWINKVAELINEGADPHVFDDYYGNSIIIEYVISGIDRGSLYIVVKYLLEIGVLPTNKVFVNCLMYGTDLAELVMVASNNTIDVNMLDIWDMPVHSWVVKELMNKRNENQIKYLISKGLRTDAISFSIDNILVLTR